MTLTQGIPPSKTVSWMVINQILKIIFYIFCNYPVIFFHISSSGINYFSNRIKGKGKKSSTCQSKIREKLTWVPIHKPSKRKNVHENLIVHHNFAKSNDIKIQHAKDFGLWLNLRPDDWCQATHK